MKLEYPIIRADFDTMPPLEMTEKKDRLLKSPHCHDSYSVTIIPLLCADDMEIRDADMIALVDDKK